jgi:hypothetical protein
MTDPSALRALGREMVVSPNMQLEGGSWVDH